MPFRFISRTLSAAVVAGAALAAATSLTPTSPAQAEVQIHLRIGGDHKRSHHPHAKHKRHHGKEYRGLKNPRHHRKHRDERHHGHRGANWLWPPGLNLHWGAPAKAYREPCRTVSKIVWEYGHQRRVYGTQCFDRHGRPYIVAGSRHYADGRPYYD